MKLTQEENFWLSILRLNKLSKIKEIDKSIHIWRFRIRFHWRSSKNFWGRFGGGWNWQLGAQWSKSTIIMNLLICQLIIYFRKKESK